MSYYDKILDLLLTQFQDSPNIKYLLENFSIEADVYQTALNQVLALTLANAPGNLLDRYGAMIGAVNRQSGQSDEQYRPLVFAQLLINTYKGSVEELLTFFRVLGATQVYYKEYPPARVYIQYNNIPETYLPLNAIVLILDKGIHPITLFLTRVTDGYFGFEDDPLALGFDEGILADS